LRWKYAWMKPVLGWKVAKWAQMALPLMRLSLVTEWDRAMYRLEARERADGQGSSATKVAQPN
jgi:hypothetical protein